MKKIIIFVILCLFFYINLASANNADTVVIPLDKKVANKTDATNLSPSKNPLKTKVNPLQIQNPNSIIMKNIPATQGNLPVNQVASMVPKEDIRDIAGPIYIPNRWIWVWYAIGGIIFILLVWLLWKKFYNRSSKKMELAHEKAFRKIKKAKSLMSKDNAKAYSIAISNAMREYIETRFNIKSTSCTTNEFINKLNKTKPKGIANHTELLDKFLQSCDLAKFAKFALSIEQMQTIQDSAYSFIDTTKIDVNNKIKDAK